MKLRFSTTKSGVNFSFFINKIVHLKVIVFCNYEKYLNKFVLINDKKKDNDEE